MEWNDAQADVQPFLQGGESLLWSGRPRRGIRLQASDAMMIPFSLMWGGFAIFWELSVLRMHAPWFFKLWGVPFVVIGLHMMVGRFFFDAARRAKTLYAVTSQRVMIVGGRGKAVASFPLPQIPSVTTTEGRDGFGSVLLGSSAPGMAPFGALFAATARRAGAPVLEMIENPKQVAEKITRAQRDLASQH